MYVEIQMAEPIQEFGYVNESVRIKSQRPVLALAHLYPRKQDCTNKSTPGDMYKDDLGNGAAPLSVR